MKRGQGIGYCATPNHSKVLAAFLQAKEVKAEHSHARFPPETQKGVQDRFISGALRIIDTTNALIALQ